MGRRHGNAKLPAGAREGHSHCTLEAIVEISIGTKAFHFLGFSRDVYITSDDELFQEPTTTIDGQYFHEARFQGSGLRLTKRCEHSLCRGGVQLSSSTTGAIYKILKHLLSPLGIGHPPPDPSVQKSFDFAACLGHKIALKFGFSEYGQLENQKSSTCLPTVAAGLFIVLAHTRLIDPTAGFGNAGGRSVDAQSAAGHLVSF